MLESARPYAQGELRLTIATRLADLTPRVSAPRRALKYIDELKSLMPESGRGTAYLREAVLHNKAGDHDRALTAIDHARRLLPEADPATRAAIDIAESEAHYHMSALDRATAAAQAGLHHLSTAAAPSAADRGALLNQLGKIALANADYAGALEYYEEKPRPRGEVRPQRPAGDGPGEHQRRASSPGEPQDAEQVLDRCLETARENGNLPTMAFANMTAGALHHQRGQLGRAIEAYRECRALFRRLGNRTQLARTLHNLGVLYSVCGDLSRAKAHNDEARRLAQQSGVGRIVALTTVVDGILHAEMGEVDLGETRLREGVRLHTNDSFERPIEALVELADFQRRWRSVDAATSTLEEIERGLEDRDSPLLRARADLLRGRILADRGDDAAVEVLKQARDRFAGLDRPLFVRDAEIALAQCALNHGEREACRCHLGTAREIQNEVAGTLPTDLRAVFETAAAQQQVVAVEGLLTGRPGATAPIAPDGADADQPLTVATDRPGSLALAVRKSEWTGRYDSIIGRSSRLYRVFHILDRIADTDGTVLIHGESGTGKELIAEAIHRNSPRAEGPFVKLNCAALVESLLLSELFGHERGSFTGAHQRKIGRFEMATGGTIFLDEIGDISPKTQVALLRVLQEREFERVGGGKPIKVDARIIFATNRDLAQMVREGGFREDLFYRLKGISIDLPPLRERPEDIDALAEHFLTRYAAESGSVAKSLAPDALALLQDYAWPGNIRELENIIRSVALFAEGASIEARDFDEYRELFQSPSTGSVISAPAAPAPAGLTPAGAESEPTRPAAPVPTQKASESRTPEEIQADLLMAVFAQGVPLPELKKRIQEQAIAQALRLTQGNITRAAEVLGMRRPRLSQIINASDSLKALAQGASK